ncbi:disulfide bond formation protein B [Patescibacteria group bacterium]|nr:disulfide bond formation protein B [Patescibacteria group bacterium]
MDATLHKPSNHPANYVIFIQAMIAMMGSLYFSNFGDPVSNAQAGNFFPTDGGFEPCGMCRWSRILMYPIARFSLWALIRQDRKIVTVIQRVSVAGILLSTYHYLLQKTTFIKTSALCTLQNPCSALQVDYFGIITIPFMALIAFIIILISCFIVKANTPKEVQMEHHHFS